MITAWNWWLGQAYPIPVLHHWGGVFVGEKQLINGPTCLREGLYCRDLMSEQRHARFQRAPDGQVLCVHFAGPNSSSVPTGRPGSPSFRAPLTLFCDLCIWTFYLHSHFTLTQFCLLDCSTADRVWQWFNFFVLEIKDKTNLSLILPRPFLTLPFKLPWFYFGLIFVYVKAFSTPPHFLFRW